MNNYKFDNGEDPKNTGILIPRYRARGRMTLNGTRLQEAEYKNPDENDLVEVRSIITKQDSPDIVTPDCLSSRIIELTGIKPGDGIGASFGTSFTEAITQGILGLKHGGHERVIDETAYFKAPCDCKIKEDGKWIILDCGKSKKLKYPRPENLVLVPGEEFKEGDIIGTAYNTTSPILKLNATVKLMRAKASDGVRYFEKDNVVISDCYAYEAGTIEYRESKRGDIEVWIGSHQYDYNPNCMYYYPDGTKIKKFQRFCSGVANMGHVSAELGGNLRDIYLIFRDQFYSLQDKGFPKKHIVTESVQEELVEMLFISLINVNYDSKKSKVENIEFLGTQGGVMNTGSFYTMLSYGHSSKVVSKALKGDINMKDDVMTATVLGLLLNNNLDNEK